MNPVFQKITLPSLNYDLTAHTTDQGREYRTPEGKVYPSASTISKILNRDAIASWRARVGTEAADKKTKRGADRGTGVHLICEKYLLGQLSPIVRAGMMPTTKELFLQIKTELDKHVQILYAIEQSLYSDRLRVAGRADAIATWDNELAIIDFKTAAKPKPEAWILNYFVQSAAYAEMFEERTGMAVNKIVIAMAVEDGNRAAIYVKEKGPYLPVLQECIDTYYKENQ